MSLSSVSMLKGLPHHRSTCRALLLTYCRQLVSDWTTGWFCLVQVSAQQLLRKFSSRDIMGESVCPHSHSMAEELLCMG
jgi:hypothetical protein